MRQIFVNGSPFRKNLFLFSKIHLHQLAICAQLQWPKQEKTEHNYAFYFFISRASFATGFWLHLVSAPHNITNDFPWYLTAESFTISHFNPAANNSSLDFSRKLCGLSAFKLSMTGNSSILSCIPMIFWFCSKGILPPSCFVSTIWISSSAKS